jgi:hypothetical protein
MACTTIALLSSKLSDITTKEGGESNVWLIGSRGVSGKT